MLIKCPECGEMISDSVCKCIHCGAEIKPRKEVKSKIIRCHECGTTFSSLEAACPKCGCSVEGIRKRKKLSNIIFSCITVILIATICSIIYYYVIYLPQTVPINTMEQMISDIGTVSENSQKKIESAEDYYAALTSDQKRKIRNYKILEKDRADYNQIIIDSKAVKEVENAIDTLSQSEYPTQIAIDEVQTKYDTLTDTQKTKIKNYNDFIKAKDIKPYEKYAIVATNALKNSLKNADSLKISDISFKESDEQTLGAGYVKISYSATNSFGAAIDSLTCIDITQDGNVGFWNLGLLLGNLDSGTSENIREYNISTGDEFILDPVRIMNNLDN